MLTRLLFKYRLHKLLKLCKKLNLYVVSDGKLLPHDPVFIAYKHEIQLGLVLGTPRIRIYAHGGSSHPYVLVYLTHLLTRVFFATVSGYYQPAVDNNRSSVRHLSLVKDRKPNETMH